MNTDDSCAAFRIPTLRVAVGAFCALFLVCALPTSAGSGVNPNRDGFAKCLANKKILMYGSFYCSHCDDQKHLFGDSFQYVPYVECSIPGSREMTFSCKFAQIQHTPTWILGNGERLIGVQPLQTLSAKTGCPLQ